MLEIKVFNFRTSDYFCKDMARIMTMYLTASYGEIDPGYIYGGSDGFSDASHHLLLSQI